MSLVFHYCRECREIMCDSQFNNQLLSVAPPSCKPVNYILFLKTHKTGSSTVTNILNRYGDSRDLLFAVPASEKSYSFYWPQPFLPKFTRPVWRSPNILCNHARYNKITMNWLFPKETTRYITMLREPTQHFESVFNFFHLGKRFLALGNVSSPLETFLQNATSHLEHLDSKQKSSSINLIRNPALFELGLDAKYHSNSAVVRNYIQFLQKEFDIVILMEYFDESLILLKRRFCWKMHDILYFKLNERREKDKQELSTKAKERILEWNWGDALLYDSFNQTLWKMIKEEGTGFFNDLAEFRKELQSIKKSCLQEGNFLTKPYAGRLVQGYALKANLSKELTETCNRMITNEIPYLDHHRERMNKQLQNIMSNYVDRPDLL